MFEEGFGNSRLFGLKEIGLPDPVSYLPQTAGWYVLFLLLLLVSIWLGYTIFRRYRANRYRRQALDHLKEIEQSIPDLPPSEVVSRLAILLKRTVLAAWPRTQVASLHGEAWLSFLNRSSRKEAFSKESARALSALIYWAPEEISASQGKELLRDTRYWIKYHHA